jgi:Protein of unknown function (DUF1236)
MKGTLLIATAVAALLTGTGLAAAEQKDQRGHGAAQAARPAPAARAPAARAPVAPRAPAVVRQSTPRAPAVTRAPSRPQFERRVTSTPQRTREAPSINRHVERGDRIGRENRTISTGTVGSERTQREERRENRGTRTEREERGRAVRLSSEQRSRVREVILRGRNAPRVAHPDFDVRVGYRIPRERLHFALLPLPSTIVDIEPDWEGYLYFLVGDEIVVVDPDTYEIVAVLPA